MRNHRITNEIRVRHIQALDRPQMQGRGNKLIQWIANLYNSAVETPLNDASYGMLAFGKGKGQFEPVSSDRSGLNIEGEIRSISKIRLTEGKNGWLIARNNDTLLMGLKTNDEY